MDLKEEQRLLALHGDYLGKLDGLEGLKTRAARIAVAARYGVQLGPEYERCLIDVAAELVAPAPGADGNPVAVKRLLARKCMLVGMGAPEQVAYMWATADHETAHTWACVREGLGVSDAWRKRKLRYYPWYGRGLPQLTWERNYRKYERLTGVPLTKDPDLALEPGLSAFILVHGARTGLFTGRNLPQFIRPGAKPDWIWARRVINGFFPGRVRAKAIAKVAEGWVEEARLVLVELERE